MPRRSRPRAESKGGFYAAVYAAVRAIPRGCVATYGEIARLVGRPRGARAVGWALRALDARSARRVPWHRVVGQGGRISLRGGSGPIEQRRRLEAEGLRFVHGRVDLRQHGLEPPSAALRPARRPRR